MDGMDPTKNYFPSSLTDSSHQRDICGSLRTGFGEYSLKMVDNYKEITFFVLYLSFTCMQTWWQELQQLFWILSWNEDGGQRLNMVKKKYRRNLNFWWEISLCYYISSRLSPVDFFYERKIKLYLVQAISTKHTILLIKLGVWEIVQ